MKRLLGLLICSVSSMSANAVYFIDGNELLDKMKDETAIATFSFAQGYVTAVADSADAFPWVCIPTGVKVGQLMDVTKRYLESHPETRHINADQLVNSALRVAWSCPKK